MAKVKRMNWNADGTVHAWRFFCPGCEEHHAAIEGRWTFNGDVNRPTFTPSLLITRTMGEEQRREVCHIFVTDGKIQYLTDCTHRLAGQTVDMEDLD